MKKLLGLLALLVCTSAHADYVVTTPYLSGADVTISSLNNNQNAIVNTLNGNVEGGINIKAGSINTVDLAQAVSPVTRWSESFNNYTVSGMLPATDAGLTSFISAGVSYVNGYRLEVGATAKEYTASRDTFVYINEGGYYQYCEEPNGTDACGTPPSNALLLAEVITDGDVTPNITTVNDLRQLSIQITTTTTNFPANYRSGATVSRDTATTMHVEPGEFSIGNTIYSRTTDTSSKELATSTNWIEGAKPFSAGGIFVYAYNDAGSSWNFKYSSADPVASDSLGNANGVLRYYSDGGTTYRAIGWAYMSADQITAYNFGNFKDTNVPNSIQGYDASNIQIPNQTYTSKVRTYFYSSGNPISVKLKSKTYYTNAQDALCGIISFNGSQDIQSETLAMVEAGDASGTNVDARDLYLMNHKWSGQQGLYFIDYSFKRGNANENLGMDTLRWEVDEL